MSRVFNYLLLIAILCGVVLLGVRSRVLANLKKEHSRLSGEFGVLDVKDSSKFLITRIETDDPMHFLWRCYYPAGLTVEERSGFGKSDRSGMGSSSVSGEFLHRVRFEMLGDQVRVHVADRGGGGRNSERDANLVGFLNDHWTELEVQVLAADGAVEIEAGRALEFLTIRIPKDLVPELEQRAGKRIADRYRDVPFYQTVYGTPEAMIAYDEAQAEAAQ